MSDIPGNPKVSRKLAAILAADIAGYSALMGNDERSTVRELKGHQAVILPMVGEHGGRVIDTAGDGILAEFGSVVNAVECAVSIQKTMVERNANVEEPRRMRFRIGVNHGDVIHDETRVYGDGVNVAARLESIAEPGGIYISGKVYDEITGKVTTNFQDLGLQQLKNIALPVRVYRVQTGQAAPIRTALALPDKPSIAVLPFANLSGDPKEDYLSDGITEDIITELSRFSELFVIARNSSFQYKAKSPDIRQVGRELGVRHVLEGSIRRAGDRVRITAQLIDASTGGHRWAERYDRKLEDVFVIQDEVARMIVSIIAAHVNKAEAERTLLKPPATWQTYDYFMRAANVYASYLSSWKVEELYEARRLFERSISIDPNFARAYAELSRTYGTAWLNSVDKGFRSAAVLDRAVQLAHEALRLDPNLPQAHAQMGMLLTCKHEHDGSIVEFEKAIALNTNYTDWRFILALVCAGEFARAIQVGEAHIRLDPFYLPVAVLWMGFAYYELRRYAQALLSARECVARAPNFRSAHCLLAATFAQLGRKEEARAEVVEILRIEPKYTISITRALALAKHREHYLDGLRMAGVPE